MTYNIVCNEFGYDSIVLSVTSLEKNINIEKAIHSACEEYISTDEGKKVYADNGNCFNWGDFAANVPNDLCRKYGFIIDNVLHSDMVVELNDQLVD